MKKKFRLYHNDGPETAPEAVAEEVQQPVAETANPVVEEQPKAEENEG